MAEDGEEYPGVGSKSRWQGVRISKSSKGNAFLTGVMRILIPSKGSEFMAGVMYVLCRHILFPPGITTGGCGIVYISIYLTAVCSNG